MPYGLFQREVQLHQRDADAFDHHRLRFRVAVPLRTTSGLWSERIARSPRLEKELCRHFQANRTFFKFLHKFLLFLGIGFWKLVFRALERETHFMKKVLALAHFKFHAKFLFNVVRYALPLPIAKLVP